MPVLSILGAGEMGGVAGAELVVPCFSLAMLLAGAVVGAGVAAFSGASRFLPIAVAGAVGGVIGGWLAFLPFLMLAPVLVPDARDLNPGIVFGAVFLGVVVGSLVLSILAARWDNTRKPPSTGV